MSTHTVGKVKSYMVDKETMMEWVKDVLDSGESEIHSDHAEYFLKEMPGLIDSILSCGEVNNNRKVGLEMDAIDLLVECFEDSCGMKIVNYFSTEDNLKTLTVVLI